MRNVKAVCPTDSTHNKFVVEVQLAADWLVNDVGECEEDLGWTKEVIKGPENVQTWKCYECGATAVLTETTDRVPRHHR